METNLLDRMLETYLTEQTPVTVTLQNKIRVSGRIKAFDSYVIVMEDQKQEILYRHAVSCLSPLAQAEQKRQPAAKQAGSWQRQLHPRPAKSSSVTQTQASAASDASPIRRPRASTTA